MDDLGYRFAAGQPDAMRELYRAYSRPVLAVAYRVLGDSSLAEEAVQQTFLQAWRAADRFDHTRDLAPWLFTITRRVSIDLHRRERRHQADTVDDHDLATLPTSMEATWEVWEVRRAVDRLPDDERSVLVATHFYGLTQREAAQRLDVPIGTIKSRSYRAYRRLSGLLAHTREASA